MSDIPKLTPAVDAAICALIGAAGDFAGAVDAQVKDLSPELHAKSNGTYAQGLGEVVIEIELNESGHFVARLCQDIGTTRRTIATVHKSLPIRGVNH